VQRHYARLAELYSERLVEAVSNGDYLTAARYDLAYREAASRCRVLGEQMRGETAADPLRDGRARLSTQRAQLRWPAGAPKLVARP
jgi:hypothetical protein